MQKIEGITKQHAFIIKCCKCGREQKVDKTNIGDFVNEYAWKRNDFMLGGIKIAAFVTHDTLNQTVMCECGNKVYK